MPMMMPDAGPGKTRSGNERADDAATIRRLQGLLALAVDARDDLIRRGMDCLPEIDRHWFVPDAPVGRLCAACGTPEDNARHVPRGRTV